MQLALKLTENAWTKVKQPYIMLSANVWTPLRKLYAKTDAGWHEVWPGQVVYTHEGTDYNMNAAVAFGNPTIPSDFIFINNGIIGGNAGAALTSGLFPAGSTLTIINNGRIQGFGGAGGDFNGDGSINLAGNGGDALVLQFATALQNLGQIYGGGGGGAGAEERGGSNDNSAPGGGGSGDIPGITNRSAWRPSYFYAANYGTTEAGGTNDSWPGQGVGGNPGQPGGAFTTPIGSSSIGFTNPGLAGNSIVNSHFLTSTIGSGSILGPQVS